MMVERSKSLYGRLLLLYPKPFRDEFGLEMAQCFAWMLEDVGQDRRQLLRLWVGISADLLLSLTQQHLASLRGTMKHNRTRNTLYTSTAVLMLIGTIMLGFGGINLFTNNASYFSQPTVKLSWTTNYVEEPVAMRVYRTEFLDMVEDGCNAPLSSWRLLPTENLRMTLDGARSLPPTGMTWRLNDSYGLQREAAYCYRIETVEADGTSTLNSPLVHEVGAHPAEFTFGNVMQTLVGTLLITLGWRVGKIGRNNQILQPAVI